MKTNVFHGFIVASILFCASAFAGDKALTVICDDWPPYQISQKGKITGFCTRLVEETMRRMSVTIRPIEMYPWKRAMVMMESGQADALFSANFTRERVAFAHYPDEMLVKSPWVVWMRNDGNLSFNSLDDLKNRKIGLVRGYSYTPELWNFVKKNSHVEEVADDVTNFRKLNAGRIDFTVAELGNGLFILKSKRLGAIIPLKNRPIKEDGLFIIFNKNRIEKSFVDRFSAELKLLKSEPYYTVLKQEYFPAQDSR